MEIRDFFSTLKISSAALNAYKTQLSLTAENIANATTTRTEEGTPYQRKTLLKSSNTDPAAFSRMLDKARVRLKTSSSNHIETSMYEPRGLTNGISNLETDIQEQADVKRVYEPNHPDADPEGYVTYPDINVVWEMLEMITASRAYEANVTVMNSVKSLAKKSLEI